MKSLKESILGNMESKLSNMEDDIIIAHLFSDNIDSRIRAFNILYDLITSYKAKQHKSTNKMKNSDNYFIEFLYPVKVENGEATNEIINQIQHVYICKRVGLSYKTICVGAVNNRLNKKVSIYELNWSYTQPNFTPKNMNCKLYEVPKELNDLFEQIQMEAYNHR